MANPIPVRPHTIACARRASLHVPHITIVSPPTVRSALVEGADVTATARMLGGVLLTTSLYEYGRRLLTWPLTATVRLYDGTRLSVVTHRTLVWARKHGAHSPHL
jgi:hypothetical protein